jgi:hypothetical protein
MIEYAAETLRHPGGLETAGEFLARTAWIFESDRQAINGASPRQLYGAHLLAAHPQAPVMVCEGENSADAMQKIFSDHVVVASLGEAPAAARADWTLVAGRTVTIWPNNSKSGADYEREVGSILLGLKCKVSTIDVAELAKINSGDRKPDFEPRGWGAANAIREWSNLNALREAALRLVRPFEDPLEGLVQRTATDVSAPFARETLGRLAALQKEDIAAFEAFRSQLKKTGCRVTALDKAIDALDEKAGKARGRSPTQADVLIDLAEAAKLFHTPDSTAFADLDVSGHRETWPVRSKGFRRYLARRFFKATGGAPSSEALQSALNVIEARAHFDAPERIVRIRVGGLNGKLYLDLADEKWRAVEIDARGWRLVDNPPVRFCRPSGMKPLPVPAPKGSIEKLRSFLNVRSDSDFVLVVAWALAVLRDRGPYPVLVLSGEQGSSKSTAAAILRGMLDPNTAPLRALPREDRDLFIAASNGHVLAFDNVSGLPYWISDTMCRLATGGGFAVRQLYTDQDEVLFDAARPQILNGIEDMVTRPDLADRAIFLRLEPIAEERRRTGS